MTQRRHCEHPGCRAWAKRGQTLCYAHFTQRARQRQANAADTPTAELDGARAALDQRIEEAVSRFAAEANLERETLSEEIGALRIVLARLLAEEDDPARLATSIPRVVDAVVRAVRAQHALTGEMAEGLSGAVTQILVELGLGGES